ncbi:MAG: transcriptional repressor [Paludibacteraceae bacterium]|nr:transcriptional repressor [Paludibacteraceae bacterium]
MNSKKNISELLLKNGIRPSVQRIAVLSYLHSHYTHPTVDVIYSDLSPEMPTLSRTTIYNTLKLFSESEIVKCITIDEHHQHFDGNINPHAHFICHNCGTIEDIFYDSTEKFNFPQNPNLHIERSEIFYYGLCKKCYNI